MNWIRVIGSVIGTFWLRLFKPSSAIMCLRDVSASTGVLGMRSLMDWTSSQINAEAAAASCCVPYPIYIIASSVTPRNAAGTGWGDLLTGSLSTTEWSARLLRKVGAPDAITNAPLNPSHTLLRGYDFTLSGDSLLLKADPAKLDLGVAYVLDGSGNAVRCLTAYGTAGGLPSVKDAIDGFYGGVSAGMQADLWGIHVQGPSLLRIKKLIAEAAGSAVCECDGTVMGIWGENGYYCADIGGRLHFSKAPPADALVPGRRLRAGDVIFGSLRLYDGRSPIPADASKGIDYLEAMTDAGPIRFPNAPLASIPASGSPGKYILNVRSLNPASYAAYEARCNELLESGEAHEPVSGVPATANPAMYIAGMLRRGRCLIASTYGADEARLASVAAALGKCASGMGIITIYRRANA